MPLDRDIDRFSHGISSMIPIGSLDSAAVAKCETFVAMLVIAERVHRISFRIIHFRFVDGAILHDDLDA
jgi:hypothetical protein